MTHNEVIELLPWYVNQSLAENERQDVAAHLSNCAPCGRELEVYESIQLAVVETAEAVPEPSKDLFRRAMGDIQHYEQQKAEQAETSSISWLTGFLAQVGETLFGWIGPAPVLARVVVATQFLLVVALAGGLSLSLWKQGDYVTESGKTSGRGDGTTIAVRFNESITEAQLRQTVAEINGTIVAGPSALGLYMIEVPIPPNKTDDVDKILQSLKSKSTIILNAERKE